MTRIALALATLSILTVAADRQPATAAGTAKPGSPSIPGFALKKSSPTNGGKVELWERGTDGAQLRIEHVPKATVATVETRLKAVNAKLPQSGRGSEELLYLFDTNSERKGWTNYRGTTNFTFRTYRFWRLQNGSLALADITFPKGKPSHDVAREAFRTVKKAADAAARTSSGI